MTNTTWNGKESLSNIETRGIRRQPLALLSGLCTYKVYTCKYLLNWENYAKGDLNLKCSNWEFFWCSKISTVCTVKKNPVVRSNRPSGMHTVVFRRFWKRKSESEVAQSCPTLCDPMDCSLPGSSVHGIFQARVLEWGAIAFFGRSFWPRDWTRVSRIVGRRFTICVTRESNFFARNQQEIAWNSI